MPSSAPAKCWAGAARCIPFHSCTSALRRRCSPGSEPDRPSLPNHFSLPCHQDKSGDFNLAIIDKVAICRSISAEGVTRIRVASLTKSWFNKTSLSSSMPRSDNTACIVSAILAAAFWLVISRRARAIRRPSSAKIDHATICSGESCPKARSSSACRTGLIRPAVLASSQRRLVDMLSPASLARQKKTRTCVRVNWGKIKVIIFGVHRQRQEMQF